MRTNLEFDEIKKLISPHLLLNVGQLIDCLLKLDPGTPNHPISEEDRYRLVNVDDYKLPLIDEGCVYDDDKDEWFDNEGESLGDDAEKACHTLNLAPYELEVLERWHVSPWLAERLEEKAEQVVELPDLNLRIWCRTASGRYVMLDHCMERITDEFINPWL